MSDLHSDLLDVDARTLSGLIHGRAVSCREVMEETLARVEALNPAVNAIVSQADPASMVAEATRYDELLARGQTLGWMHGMPLAIKDLADVRGFVTTKGSPLFANRRATEDSLFVQRLRGAGAIFFGKTNTPEFGLGSQTYNSVFGTTKNAYDQTLTSGGSSGGSAVAVALRMVAVTDGSDMMGSLRNPAAFNNVFGFRPSMGRVPHGPDGDLFFQQLACDGPIARSVTDLAMLLSTMAGHDPRAPLSLREPAEPFAAQLVPAAEGGRIGWLGDLDGRLPVEAGILDLCEDGLGTFADLGAEVDRLTLDFSTDEIWTSWVDLRSFLVAGALDPLAKDPVSREKLKPEAQFEIEHGQSLSSERIFAASETRGRWYRHLLALFERFDALVLPSAQVFPFAHTQPWPREIAGRPMDTYHRWMEVVTLASLAGVPAINVPVGFDGRGRPMGMQILGRPGGDLDLLRLAHAYDLRTRWPETRRPPLLSAATA